jgi:mannose-6-phosphate isomerase-like protein (cupin superfamily)
LSNPNLLGCIKYFQFSLGDEIFFVLSLCVNIHLLILNMSNMKITKYQDQHIKETPHQIDVREMYNKESAMAMLIALKPGESLKPHKTPVDVFFFIVEGRPTIHIGDESEVCEVDTLIESPAEIVHNISNNTESLARILVVKAPRPVILTKVL